MAQNIIIQFTETEFREIVKSSVSEILRENTLTKTEELNKLFSVKEASNFLNLAPQTLYGFTSNRTIPFIKRGKKLYFKKFDLEVWLSEGKKDSIKEIANKKGGKYE
jgi:excisionase family DNA binding protein